MLKTAFLNASIDAVIQSVSLLSPVNGNICHNKTYIFLSDRLREARISKIFPLSCNNEEAVGSIDRLLYGLRGGCFCKETVREEI